MIHDGSVRVGRVGTLQSAKGTQRRVEGERGARGRSHGQNSALSAFDPKRAHPCRTPIDFKRTDPVLVGVQDLHDDETLVKDFSVVSRVDDDISRSNDVKPGVLDGVLRAEKWRLPALDDAWDRSP